MNKETIVPSEVDLTDSNIQQCPYSAYKMLRNEAPVYQDPKTGFFIVTRYEYVRAVSYTHLTLPTNREV